MSLSKPSLSYVSNPLIKTFTDQTIPERLEHFAELHPNKLAFLDVNVNGEVISEITYKVLHDKSVCLAKGLISEGVKKGDIVGICLPNTPEWLYCFFGIILSGGIPLGLEFSSKDGQDIQYIIEKSEKCTFVIIDAQSENEILEVCEKIFGTINDDGNINCETLPNMRKVIFTNPPPLLRKPVVVKDIISIGERLGDVKFPNLSSEDFAVLVHTSGTTGTNKIVSKTHQEFLHLGHQLKNILELNGNSVYFNYQPMAWISSLPVTLMCVGLTRVSCSLPALQTGDVTAILMNVLEKQRCTTAFLHPSICANLVRRDCSIKNGWRLRSIITGGEPIPSHCFGITPKIVDIFVTAYGSTEVGLITCAKVSEPTAFTDFDAGCPTDGIELKIVNEVGDVVPRNVQGEIYIRKALRFHGYLNDPIRNKKILTPDGWYRTDDIAMLTEADHVIIYGRKSDMIKICNDIQDELISPFHMEKEIKEMAGISDVCVLPLTTDSKLTEICACVEMEKEKELCESEIANFLKSKVLKSLTYVPDPIFPTKYVFFEKLPRTSVGKINRKKTSEEAAVKLQNKC